MSDGSNTRPPREMNSWLAWLRGLARGKGEQSLRESLEGIIDEHAEATFHTPDQGEREMIRNLLEFGEMTVDDVMVPRADIYAVPATISLDKLIETFLESGHSRLVVYGESLDDVTGMVHVRDVLQYWNRRDDFSLQAILRKVLFIPPSQSLRDVLAQALGVTGRVVKRRLLLLCGQTRIHLDRVTGLGDFLELEVVLREDQSAAQGEAIAEGLCARLGLDPDARIAGAYRDLLAAAGTLRGMKERKEETPPAARRSTAPPGPPEKGGE